MRFLKVSLLILLFAGCKTAPTAVEDNRQSTMIGNQTSAARTQLSDKIAGDVTGAQRALATQPESRSKDVANMFLDDALRITGIPTAATKSSFEKLADQLLSENALERAKAESSWAKVQADNDALKARLDQLEKNYQASLAKERADAQAKANAAIAEARQKAEAHERTLITSIFFGGGFLLLAAGALVFFLMGSNPIFGPKVGIGLGAAGALSIGTGIAILQLLNHPNVIWWGLGIITAILATTAGIMLSNHYHHTEATNGTGVQS